MGDPVERSSYAAYLALEAKAEQRYEFVDGVVYATAGSSPEHSRLAIGVASELRTALAGHGCAVYGSELEIRIDATNRTTYADVAVVCGPEVASAIDPHAITNPTVIIGRSNRPACRCRG